MNGNAAVDISELIIKDLVFRMSVVLNNDQLRELDMAARNCLMGYRIDKECTDLSTDLDENEHILQVFCANKKLENKSDKSITQYVRTTRNMLDAMNMNYKKVKTNHIKFYLAKYQHDHNVKASTIVNMKRFISAFYGWAQEEGLVYKNPCRAIKNIKVPQKKKEYLTDTEKEQLRDACKDARETAMIDFLLSTGVRVSELVNLKIENVDFYTDTVTVYSTKSLHYRTVYLNAKAKKHLLDYINTRTDNNPSLFVSIRRPHNTVKSAGIQYILRTIAKRANVLKHCTVHIFRKTFATTLARNGCKLEYISSMLGHAETSTTLKYYLTLDEFSKKEEFVRCVG